MTKATPIPPALARLVRARADDHCEGCGRYASRLELHHRKFRGRGGAHTVRNLVALCGWGNHTGCHGRAHGPKAPEGWAVSTWGDPESEPFLRRGVLVPAETLEELARRVA